MLTVHWQALEKVCMIDSSFALFGGGFWEILATSIHMHTSELWGPLCSKVEFYG